MFWKGLIDHVLFSVWSEYLTPSVGTGLQECPRISCLKRRLIISRSLQWDPDCLNKPIFVGTRWTAFLTQGVVRVKFCSLSWELMTSPYKRNSLERDVKQQTTDQSANAALVEHGTKFRLMATENLGRCTEPFALVSEGTVFIWYDHKCFSVVRKIAWFIRLLQQLEDAEGLAL